MTPEELREIGERLFGSRWQTKLARSLENGDGTHVNPRTVRRWLSGESHIPAGVALLLHLWVRDREMVDAERHEGKDRP